MEILVNTEMEVTKKQYNLFRSNLSGIVAHRVENGKYYIKVLMMMYNHIVRDILTNH